MGHSLWPDLSMFVPRLCDRAAYEISILSLSQRSWKLNGEGTLLVITISRVPKQVETVNIIKTMVEFILKSPP